MFASPSQTYDTLSRSPIQNWQPWAKKQSNQGAKAKPTQSQGGGAAAASAPVVPEQPAVATPPKNQPKLFSPANDVSTKGVKRKLNDMPLWDASELLSTPTKIPPDPPVNPQKSNPPPNHRPYQSQQVSQPVSQNS